MCTRALPFSVPLRNQAKAKQPHTDTLSYMLTPASSHLLFEMSVDREIVADISQVTTEGDRNSTGSAVLTERSGETE